MKRLVIEHLPGFLKPLWARLEASPLGYRLARGVFWSVAGSAISRGLTLVASILIARLLGKVTFGELGIIQSTVGMLAIVAGFGAGITANKHVAELRTRDPARSGRIIALSSIMAWTSGSLMALLLAMIAPWLAAHTLAAPALTPLLRVGALLLLVGAINGAQLGVLAGFEAFKTVASVNFYAGIASFPLLIGGVLWLGLEGAVWGLVASQALNCLLSYAAIRREARRAAVPLAFAGWWRERRLIWTFSLPAVFSAILGGPVFWACSAMIVNQPDGYGEMGVFNAANQWRTAIQFLPGMMAMAALPMLSSLQGPEDAARFRKMLKANLLLSFGAAMIAALPIALLSPLIMAAYGKGFASGAIVLVILCGAAVISATLNVIGQAIASQGRMWVGFMLNALWAAVMLGTCALWKGMGATGLALASLAAYGVHFCSVSAYVYRRLRIIQ